MNRRATWLPALVALAVAVPLVIAGCSSGNSASTSSLTVEDYYNTDPGMTTWGNLLTKCGKAQGVTIKRNAVPGANLISKVLQQASSRTLPDVLMLDNPDLQQIAGSGALSPLSTYGITTDGYAKGVVQASTYQGQLYGLQPITNTIALYYNKDILAKAGVQPPKTWDELKVDAKKLTVGKQYGMAFSAINTYEGTWQFLPFMWTNGGDEKTVASAQNAQALQLWVDLVKDHSVSASAVNWAQADVNDQFKAGNAAMMVNGPWQQPVLDTTAGLHYGIVQIPTPKAGQTTVAPLGGETWTVPQTGDKNRQAAAAKFVTCLNSDANQLAIAKLTQTIPTKTAVAQQFAIQDPAMKTYVDLVPSLRARTGELGADWPKAATKIYTAVQAALAGGVPPMKALQQAQNG
ncbi:sugar ABC transporter substrate-binding protein [Fodinicola feengrottensis]|uniref:Sugar ABC transporter substrate-binding protein n=1 Tax=Fodinicola feengrottensis TaxID=435914 RepID=A0ABN2HFX7_9ACTN